MATFRHSFWAFAACLWCLAVAAMVPWGLREAERDGLAGDAGRAGLYALGGSLAPLLLGLLVSWWQRSRALGIVTVAVVAVMAWRGQL